MGLKCDIDALTAEIASGANSAAFDMNGDGVVTLADITEANVGWLAVGGAQNPADTGGNPFLSGDANLDGVVDVSDFNTWNGNKFTSVAAWSLGDFNADGSIDTSDFNIWNANKFSSSNLNRPLSSDDDATKHDSLDDHLADQRVRWNAVPLQPTQVPDVLQPGLRRASLEVDALGRERREASARVQAMDTVFASFDNA